MPRINSTVNFAQDSMVREVLGVVVGIAICGGGLGQSATMDDMRAARKAALDDMNAQATKIGADAVIGIRFDSSPVNSTHVINHTVEYTAYGTAVTLIY